MEYKPSAFNLKKTWQVICKNMIIHQAGDTHGHTVAGMARRARWSARVPPQQGLGANEFFVTMTNQSSRACALVHVREKQFCIQE